MLSVDDPRLWLPSVEDPMPLVEDCEWEEMGKGAKLGWVFVLTPVFHVLVVVGFPATLILVLLSVDINTIIVGI